MTPFLISVPVFLIIIIGWIFRKFRLVDEVWVHILNRFAYYVSLPALIIASFWNIDFSSRQALVLAGWSALTISIFMALVFIVLSFLKLPYKTKAAAFLIICTGNTVYMGFPIISSAFGQGALVAGSLVAVLYLILPILASIFIVRIWADKHHSVSSQLKEFFKNPLTIAAIAGIVISFIPKQIFGIDLAYKAISTIGLTASPVALFALGSFLYKRLLRRNLTAVFITSALKVAGFPLILFFASRSLISSDARSLMILLATMPSAVTTFVIAEKFSLDDTTVGNALLISTVFSFFAIPFSLAFLV